MQARFFDASIDHMILAFCEKIDKELEEASRVQRKRVTPENLVDRYGLKNPGYISFEEFLELYKNHVHYADDNNFMKPMPETNKLQGLFNTLDPDQRGKISRNDFGNMVKNKAPLSTFLTRLRKKMIKGKERLHCVISEECTDLDRLFGAQGVIPVACF